jgi:exo-beta-1,3-glucanase (GH17 family)
VSFSPYRHDQGPIDKVFPSEAEIREDLEHLAPHVRSVRSYTSLDGMDQIPRLANEFGLKVTAGAWLDGDRKKNEREIKALIASVRANPNVDRVMVGNEVLLRGDLKRAQLAGTCGACARSSTCRSAPRSRGTCGSSTRSWRATSTSSRSTCSRTGKASPPTTRWASCSNASPR